MYAKFPWVHRKRRKLPVHLTFSIAALMAFYTGSEIRDKALIGHRDGEYQILDDAAVLEFFAANSSEKKQRSMHMQFFPTKHSGDRIYPN